MKIRSTRSKRLALMASWIAKRSPFVRLSDLTRGHRMEMAKVREIGSLDGVRFVLSESIEAF